MVCGSFVRGLFLLFCFLASPLHSLNCIIKYSTSTTLMFAQSYKLSLRYYSALCHLFAGNAIFSHQIAMCCNLQGNPNDVSRLAISRLSHSLACRAYNMETKLNTMHKLFLIPIQKLRASLKFKWGLHGFNCDAYSGH